MRASLQAGKFPLLVKLLDANAWLSVQVHPDDAYGLANEGEYGKTRCGSCCTPSRARS